jgi:thiamine pyrophosphokinase
MSSTAVQERAPDPAVAEFEDLLVIVGGGEVDHDLLRELYASGGRLVGADAGADRIVAAGLKPEIIIGDFDSLKEPFSWLGKTRLMQIAEQETTDFEKALYSTRAPVTVALGMTGQRLDHTLAALDALARHGAKRHIVLVDATDVAAVLAGPFEFAVAPGDRVSIHPLASVSFRSSSGLKYPLDGLTLAPGVRTGTSNEATEGPFRIDPRTRAKPWLLILAREHLLRLIGQLLLTP